MEQGKPVILTGLRANGELHLGNYLGAVLPAVRLQQKHAGQYRVNMFVPDLHSITTPIDHASLQREINNNLAYYAAAGLDFDDENTLVYRQSWIPAHSEMAWLLSCFTYYGELQRMTQFKEKSDQLKNKGVSAGLFSYPVLMAADILLYGAQYVPVGEDQRQHLELTRDLAIRLNRHGKDMYPAGLLTVPASWAEQLKFMGLEEPVRIRSLTDPTRKMSKSVPDPRGTIMLSDHPDDAHKKILSATTDSENDVKLDFERQPGVSNLLQILALFEGAPLKKKGEEWRGHSQYGQLKTVVADKVAEFLSNFQARVETVDVQHVLRTVTRHEEVARGNAEETLARVQHALGLRS